MTVTISGSGLALSHTDAEAHPVLNIFIDGHRVWSASTSSAVASRRPGRMFLRWPQALTKHLSGRGEFTVSPADDASRVLTSRHLKFGTSKQPIDLHDSKGRLLAVNKWDRMGPTFDGSDESVNARVLDNAQAVLSALQELGYPVFVVGGTLLGAVRDGEFLPNDDDADLAFFSEFTHPADLVLQSFEMQRQLEERGFTVLRHSGAHLQILFRFGTGETDFYVDVFTAFIKNGNFFEPIHMQASLTREQILPLGTVTLGGVSLPAPADPEGWLAACYGEDWRSPDPSFHFVTPERTLRRFHNWFAEHNVFREYWMALRNADRVPGSGPSDQARRFAAMLLPNSRVVDVACGTGEDAIFFASLGHRVMGFDFDWVAIEGAQARVSDQSVDVDFRELNLADRRHMLRLMIELRSKREPVYLFVRHAIDGVIDSTRDNIWELVCRLVAAGSFAMLTNYGDLADSYDPDRPRTWHLPWQQQVRWALKAGVRLELSLSETFSSSRGKRVVLETIVRGKEPQTS